MPLDLVLFVLAHLVVLGVVFLIVLMLVLLVVMTIYRVSAYLAHYRWPSIRSIIPGPSRVWFRR